MGVPKTMEQRPSGPLPKDPIIQQSKTKPVMVDAPSQPHTRQKLGPPCSGGGHDGCQSNGLGSDLATKGLSGHMVTTRTQTSHKRIRDKGSILRPQSLADSHEGKTCTNTIRQQHHSGLLKSARRHKKCVRTPRSIPDHDMGRNAPSSPIGDIHSGHPELGGGLSKSHHTGPGGMETQAGNFPTDSNQMGPAVPGRHGIPVQLTDTKIHIKSPRPNGGRGRRTHQPMALSTSLCVSSHTTHTSPTTQNQEGKSSHHPHSPMVATQSLVCGTNSDVNGTTMDTSLIVRSSITRSGESREYTQAEFNGLDVESRVWKEEGFSNRVIQTLLTARKHSTHAVYHKVWKRFLIWSQNRNLHWQSCTSTHILDFLQEGVDKQLSTSAIKVQTSALSALFHKQWANLPEVKLFFQALQKIRPPVKNPIPPWDLNLVLRALQKAPFEPMGSVDLKFLTWKVTFLLAICSARRVSDLAALSHLKPWTIFHQDKVVLRTIPSHLPKVTSKFHINEEIILPSFCPKPTNDRERQLHSLDTVRALKFYLHRTADIRHSDALLVLFGSNKRGQQASKRSIARWLVQTILEAYKVMKREAPFPVKAHSTRKISASWALHNFASAEAICKAATWSSLHTFSKFYTLDVMASSEAAFGRKVLQAAVAHS
ncbi:hypothetical protein XENTR_v10007752 [Xenopus tropicalis]|nr:hypothetical protein XENTR_v10007752 [Xenopus tropicalis]